MVAQHIEKTEKVKKLDKLHEQTKKPKENHNFEVLSSLTLHSNSQPILDQSVTIWQRIFLTQGSNPGLPHCRQTLYHLSFQGTSTYQHQTCTKKQLLSLFGCLLPIWSTVSRDKAFWISMRSLYLRRTLSKLLRYNENCHARGHWSTEWAQFSMTPNCTSHKQCFKNWMNWVMFCLICYIHLTSCQPTTTSSSISTSFLQGNPSTTSGKQNMLSKSSSNPEAQIFMLQE